MGKQLLSDLPKYDWSDEEDDDDDDDSGPHVITTDDGKLFYQEHLWPYATKFISLMEVDDSEEFVKTLRHELYTRRVLRLSGHEISPLLIFSGTINQLALRCAKSMLSGIATGCPVDVNRTPKSVSLPIHVAAIHFLPDFASLLLTYGARLDIPCKNPFCLYRSMLPMDAGFKALSEKISWTPAQSVYGLISSLCKQMELMLGFSTGHQILAKRINDAGFDLADDVHAVKKAVKCLKSIDFQQRDLLGTRVGSPKSDREFVLEKRSISSAAAQTFQGSQTIKSRPMSTLCRPMEGQAQVAKGGAHERWHILNSSLGKTCWPVFVSAMRRRIMLV